MDDQRRRRCNEYRRRAARGRQRRPRSACWRPRPWPPGASPVPCSGRRRHRIYSRQGAT